MIGIRYVGKTLKQDETDQKFEICSLRTGLNELKQTYNLGHYLLQSRALRNETMKQIVFLVFHFYFSFINPFLFRNK